MKIYNKIFILILFVFAFQFNDGLAQSTNNMVTNGDFQLGSITPLCYDTSNDITNQVGAWIRAKYSPDWMDANNCLTDINLYCSANLTMDAFPSNRFIRLDESENKDHNLADFSINLELMKNEFNILINYYLGLIANRNKIYCISLLNKLKQISIRKKTLYSCDAGHSLFSIISNGDIYSCIHLAGNIKYTVGNIQTGFNEKKIQELQSFNVEKNSDCKKCWIRYFCSGNCFSTNLSSTGISTKPNNAKCELIKLEWNFYLSLYYEIYTKYPDFLNPEINSIKENDNC
jgi:radical SAM protein with 4Fe4S-binding SPASM domain